MIKKAVVLHVEDDAEERSMVSRLLRGRYRYIGCRRAEDAEKVLEDAEVDAVILDLALPCMNGFEFLKKHGAFLRRREIPVILTTGVEGRGIRELSREHGCRAFFRKPLHCKTLLSLLNRHFGRTAARD